MSGQHCRSSLHPLLGLASDGVYLASLLPELLVSSYLTVSALPLERGGLLSVALAVGFPRLAVSQHPTLRSPDFPQRTAIVQPT